MLKKSAFTLIEVMLSVLILSVVMIGGAFFFLHTLSQIRMSRRSRLALELAEERIEVLKTVGFSGLANKTETGLPLGGFTATRQTKVTGIDENMDGIEDYREIRVSVLWMEGATPQEVRLTTFLTTR